MNDMKKVYESAGKELTYKMLLLMQANQNDVVEWFYKPLKVLDWKSAYDLCKDGEKTKLELLLSEMESGFAM